MLLFLVGNFAEVHQPDGDFLLLNQGMTTIRLPFNPSKNDTARPIQLQTNQIAIGNYFKPLTVNIIEINNFVFI